MSDKEPTERKALRGSLGLWGGALWWSSVLVYWCRVNPDVSWHSTQVNSS